MNVFVTRPAFTVVLQTKQVIAHFFGLLSTTAGKASEVVIPVEPINLSPAIVFYGGVTLIVNVVWQGAVACHVLKATYCFEVNVATGST